MNNINISIPIEQNALTRASEMLIGLAMDLKQDPVAILEVSPLNAPAATVAVEQPAPIEQPAVTPEIDSEGVRWDARIHVDSKAILKKTGTWRLKQKIDPTIVQMVKNEQSLVQPAPAVTPAQIVPAPEQTATTEAYEVASNGQAVPVAPVEPAIDFAGLMQKITARQTSNPEFGKIIQAVLAEFNVQSLPALIPMIEVIPQIDKRLDELWQD